MQLSNEKPSGGGRVYVISAPSGCGKTTLVDALMAQDQDITRAVTHTTRNAREGEVNGVDYHFVTKEQFEAMIQNHGFLEHAEVFGNLYGTSIAEVQKHTATGKDVVLVIDWQGANSVKAIMPDAELIFIVPPSIQALEDRLSSRKQDDVEVVKQRMADAVNQIQHYVNFDYVVVNDVFAIALQDLEHIFQANRLRTAYQKVKNRALLTQLLNEKV